MNCSKCVGWGQLLLRFWLWIGRKMERRVERRVVSNNTPLRGADGEKVGSWYVDVQCFGCYCGSRIVVNEVMEMNR